MSKLRKTLVARLHIFEGGEEDPQVRRQVGDIPQWSIQRGTSAFVPHLAKPSCRHVVAWEARREVCWVKLSMGIGGGNDLCLHSWSECGENAIR